MSPRDLAVHAFWSDHALCDLYEMRRGHWKGGLYVRPSAFSLRELIAFAESLPPRTIEALGQ